MVAQVFALHPSSHALSFLNGSWYETVARKRGQMLKSAGPQSRIGKQAFVDRARSAFRQRNRPVIRHYNVVGHFYNPTGRLVSGVWHYLPKSSAYAPTPNFTRCLAGLPTRTLVQS
jgi:hypothetical protein